MSTCFVGIHAVPPMVNELSDDLRENYKIDKERPPEGEWPPHQPSSIVNLALIHYNNGRTQQELIEISKRCKEGASLVDNLTASHSNVTIHVGEIFMPKDDSKVPKHILIEGAPGIGKTVLAREIVYQWANGKILNEYKLVFLLYLRDPILHEVKSINKLLELFTSENIPDLRKYVMKSRGENVAFVFDGFDEYPAVLQSKSFITDLIKGVKDGKMFYNSTVVVTSRPTATLFLHHLVDRRIEILGFPKEERDKYVSLSLCGSLNKKQQLDKYLKQHPIIDNLCYIPLHLAILIYLFQQDSLPKTLTEMNESFIINTIYRYLEKNKSTPSGVVKKLKDLPEDIIEFIYKLSKLAFRGLESNQLVFTLDQIREMCPEVDDISGAINGFGLLQAVQHFPKKGAGRTTSVNFLHFTMQEYLAALHVSRFHSRYQLYLMRKTFWDGQFNFMWMIFVGIVGTNSKTFTSFITQDHRHSHFDTRDTDDVFPFISNGNQSEKVMTSGTNIPSRNLASPFTILDVPVDDNIYDDKRKCLHLFQCYMEAESDTEIPQEISSIFTDGKIILNNITLLPHHISSLIYFMSASSMQQWKVLEMCHCNLGDIGMNSFLEHVIKNDENMSTLEYVDLSGNKSSPWGVYCAIIRHCCVDRLTLCGDEGMKECVKEITYSLQINTILQSLTLCNIKSTCTLLVIKDLLVNNTMLKELNLHWTSKDIQIICGKLTVVTAQHYVNDDIKSSLNEYTGFIPSFDKEVESIVVNLISGLHAITSQELIFSLNRITDDAVIFIIDCLKYKNTLRKLDLAHNYISYSGMNHLSKFIKHPIPLEYVDLSDNKSSPWGVYCTVIKHCCVSSLTLCGDEGMKEYAEEILDSLRTNTILQLVTFCASRVKMSRFKERYQDVLIIDGKLYFTAPSNNEGIQGNTMLPVANNRMVNVKVLCAGDDDKWFPGTIINLSRTVIDDDAACLISFGLYNNATIRELDLSSNLITDKGIFFICDCFRRSCSLHTLILTNNLISYKGAKMISEIIVNKAIQKFDISQNNIRDKGAEAISECLKTNNTLQELNLSDNRITSEGARKVAEAIKVNKSLIKLDVSQNAMCDDGVMYISDSLKHNNTLLELNLSDSGITNEGLKYIAEAIQVLQKLILSHNDISDEEIIMQCLEDNNALNELDLSDTSIDKEKLQLTSWHTVKVIDNTLPYRTENTIVLQRKLPRTFEAIKSAKTKRRLAMHFKSVHQQK